MIGQEEFGYLVIEKLPLLTVAFLRGSSKEFKDFVHAVEDINSYVNDFMEEHKNATFEEALEKAIEVRGFKDFSKEVYLDLFADLFEGN